MESFGRIEPIGKITFLPASRDLVKDNVTRWYKEKKKIFFSISGEAVICGTSGGGVLFLEVPEGTEAGNNVTLKTWYQKRTLSQGRTLKALESLIYQADNDWRAPNSSDDLYYIHQGIIEQANITVLNPFTQKYTRISTSSPDCDTVAMNRFIEIALDELSMRNIPENVRDAMHDRPIRELFTSWYEKRMVEDDLEHIKDWNTYREIFPWCEFTFRRGTEADPLQRMHIVSAGADKADYEESWNWIHASRSIHGRQHLHGWGPILQDFPHMKAKIEKARKMASAAEQKRREI